MPRAPECRTHPRHAPGLAACCSHSSASGVASQAALLRLDTARARLGLHARPVSVRTPAASLPQTPPLATHEGGAAVGEAGRHSVDADDRGIQQLFVQVRLAVCAIA